MGRGDPASARRYCRYRCWAPSGPAAPTGREIAVRADEPVNTLSIIKIPIMILAFQDAERGLLDLDERYTVRPENLRRGSGLIQTFAPGLAPTYRDIITQMIITSDNTATDIMIARLGMDRSPSRDIRRRACRQRPATCSAAFGSWRIRRTLR